MSSPPISVSRCGYSNSRDVVASSLSFSHPTARGPRRACPAACIGKDILRRNPNPWRPLKSKFCLKTLGRRLFLYAELDLTISFPSAISLAHDSSFEKDQDILVLPLDLQKFDTHEKLAQDVLKHFGKVKRNKYRVEFNSSWSEWTMSV